MSKRVLITGISGFIGSYLAKRLNEEGYSIHGIVQPDSHWTVYDYKYKIFEGDITNFDRMSAIIEESQPNFIIHLAARTEVEKSFYDPTSFGRTNYIGTVALVEAARQLLDSSLELFIFSSTMETYGRVPKTLWTAFNEETPQFPNAPYAVAKLACEYYLKYAEEAFKFPNVILRQTNAYGRYNNDFFVVEQFITQMLKNKDEVNFGYREPYRNFLFVDDLIELYVKILKNADISRNEIFCTGPDNAIQISELATIIAEKLDWHGKINWGTKRSRPGEIYYLNSTPEKAWRILRWEPKVNLSDGLDKTIAMWKKNYELT